MNLFSFIKNKLSILEVVREYTALKKVGLYWKGHCPFHNERTASFSVSPHKEIFYCFGCHSGGDVISFIAKAENCSQLEAARHLSERYQITIPDNNLLVKDNNKEKQVYTQICTLVAKWCHAQLLNNKHALDYLDKRNIVKKSIEDFMLGYFPQGQQAIKNLLDYAKKQNIMAQDFIVNKIILEGKSNLYSPFEGRIIFPIKDHFGRLCGFGGRIYEKTDERAKYYNSHDHAFFSKGSLLFGLDRAKKVIQEKESAFLVEGYTDVIAMAQYGYENTVATLGTSCTQEHLKQLSRYTNKLCVMYDGDQAGQKAIVRLIQLCWQVSIDLYVITLPASEDPASFLNKYGTMKLLIDQAVDIFTFFINNLSADFNKKGLQEQMLLTKQLLDIIRHLEDPLKQDLLLKQAAQALDISVDTLKQELKRADKNKLEGKETMIQEKQNESKEQIPEPPASKISQLEKKLFSGILYYKGLTSEDEELLKMWLPLELKSLFEKAITFKKTNAPGDNKAIFDIFNDEEKKLVSRILIEAEDDESASSFEHNLQQFYKKQWKLLVHNVKLNIACAQKAGNTQRVLELLAKLDALKKKMLQRGIL